MSDVKQGDGWWQASDGKWYPPTSMPEPPKPSADVTPPPFTGVAEPAQQRISAAEPIQPTPPLAGSWETATGATFTVRKVRKRPRGLLIAGVAVAAVIAGGLAFMALKPTPEPTEPGPDAIGLEFVLLDLDGNVSGTTGNCYGSGGYDDFGAGMDISIKNQDGKLIGSGSTLSYEDLLVEYPEYGKTVVGDSDLDDEAVIGCAVAALVPVSEEADFYEVSVGRRGTNSTSRKEMEKNDWRVQLSLG